MSHLNNTFNNKTVLYYTMRTKAIFLLLTLLSSTLSGCTGDEESSENLKKFPEFSTVADNEELYDNARMSGSAFIVIFSAEWCNAPCYNTMFAIWDTIPELPVLVMSTDPAENAGGLTLKDWHDSADAHDDEGEETNVNLTTYAFMKGSEVAAELDIKSPGSLAFVTPEGEISYLHVGRLDDSEDIQMRWDEANSL